MFLFSGCDNKLKEAHSHVIPQTHTHTHTHTHWVLLYVLTLADSQAVLQESGAD